MEIRDLKLDGNAIGGLMLELFGTDMSTAAASAAAAAHTRRWRGSTSTSAAGIVVRCRHCQAVMIRIVQGRGRTWLDLSGTREPRARRLALADRALERAAREASRWRLQVPLDPEGPPDLLELRKAAAVGLDLVEGPAPRRVLDVALLGMRQLVAEHEDPDAEAAGRRVLPPFEHAAAATGSATCRIS